MTGSWGCLNCNKIPCNIEGREHAFLRLHTDRLVVRRLHSRKQARSTALRSYARLPAAQHTIQAVAVEPRIHQTVDVQLGDRSYPIYIGQGLLDRKDLLQQHVLGKKVLIVTNETVAPLYLDR